MLSRPGRVFGVTVSPTTASASGIWSLRDMLPSRAASSWPLPGASAPSSPTPSRCGSSYLSASWSDYPGATSYSLQYRSRTGSTYSSETTLTNVTSPLAGIVLMATDVYYSVRLMATFSDSTTTPWSNWSAEVKGFANLVVNQPSLALTGSPQVVKATSSSSTSQGEDYTLVSVDLELYSSSTGTTYSLELSSTGATPGSFLSTVPDFTYYRARQRYNYQLVGCGTSVYTSSWSSYITLNTLL